MTTILKRECYSFLYLKTCTRAHFRVSTLNQSARADAGVLCMEWGGVQCPVCKATGKQEGKELGWQKRAVARLT